MKINPLPLVCLATILLPSLMQARPSNDDFEAATILPSRSSFQTSYNPSGATTEPGETAAQFSGTVWFRWTAPGDGIATFEASGRTSLGSSMEVTIRVGQEQSLSDMPWAGVSRELTGRLARLRIPVRAGTEYRIQVENRAFVTPEEVTFRLVGLEPITHPDFAVQTGVPYFHVRPNANDNFASAFPLSTRNQSTGQTVHPNRFSATASILNATFEAGEPGDSRQAGTLWFRWTAPSTGIATFRAIGRTQSDDTVVRPLQLRIGRGTDLSNLRSAAVSRELAGLAEAQLPVRKGQTYLIQVQDMQGWKPAQTITLNLTGIAPITLATFDVRRGVPYFYVPAGSNDNMSSAFRLARRAANGKFVYPASFSATASALDSTVEPGEVAERNSSATLWYYWVAPRTGIATFEASALRSSADRITPQVRVWRGNTFNQMRLGAVSASVGSAARARLPVRQGQAYRIQLDGLSYAAPVQNMTLNLRGIEPITRPAFSVRTKVPYFYVPAGANDNFGSAAVMASRNPGTKRLVYPRAFSATASMNDATTQPGELVDSSSFSRTVWFRWTAPVSGVATFDATALDPAGGRLVPTMRIGTGQNAQNARFLNVQPVTSGGRAVATFRVVKGTTYRIQLDSGWNSTIQTATLNLRGVRRR
jgi:hypothetical protein